MSFLRLIVGLGNPGKEYEGTRHNIGFSVVDNLLLKAGKGAGWQEKSETLYSEIDLAGNKVKLLEPQTYMNNSGQPVGELARFYKIPPGEILVVHDELDLPFGVMKLKAGGGDAGHNGLRSLTACLGTSDYIRLRFGIGKPLDQEEMTSWVLGRFKPDEKQTLPGLLDECTKAVVSLAEHGLKHAQNSFNRV